MNDGSQVEYEKGIKITGFCLILASIIQMSCGAVTYNIMGYGAWWVGMFAFICGAVAIATNSKSIAAFGLITSITVIILTIVGLSWDAMGFILNDLDTCINSNTEQFYGDEKYDQQVLQCALLSSNNRDCYCIANQYDNTCYSFNLLYERTNCGLLLTKVPPILITSFAFLLLILILSCIYSCFTCCTLCCNRIDTRVQPGTEILAPTEAVYLTPTANNNNNNNDNNNNNNIPIYTAATIAIPTPENQKNDPYFAQATIVTAHPV